MPNLDVVALITAKPGSETIVEEALKALVVASRGDHGCKARTTHHSGAARHQIRVRGDLGPRSRAPVWAPSTARPGRLSQAAEGSGGSTTGELTFACQSTESGMHAVLAVLAGHVAVPMARRLAVP